MAAELDGVLRVDKPEGPTSHDVVAAARRALGTRRIGHTGTLDPFASGLLLLCVGRATRLVEYLTGLPKTYVATARLGEATDTADRTGAVTARSGRWRDLAPEEIRSAFARQVGAIMQVPPAYSAKRVEGERAYDRARRGEAVELPPVPVVIHRIDILDLTLPEVTFEVECSSGTYVRAIARDVGEALGTGAHLTRLRRTRIGRHDVEDAVEMDALTDPAAVRRAWLEPLEAVAHLPRIDVGDAEARALRSGVPVILPGAATTGGPVAVAHHDKLLAIAELDGRRLQPRKVFTGD